MTKQHPITPPPELVEQWWQNAIGKPEVECVSCVAHQAARWGADQELDACCDHFEDHLRDGIAKDLRAARRPKPPSLKEQALMALEDGDIGPGASLTPVGVCIIRRALEALPND